MKLKNVYTIVERYLEDEPRFRERKNKGRGIVNLLVKRHPELAKIDKGLLVLAIRENNSMDRCWRLALERRKELRGKDYNKKGELEEETVKEVYGLGI